MGGACRESDANGMKCTVCYDPNGKAATVTVKRGGTEVAQFGTGPDGRMVSTESRRPPSGGPTSAQGARW